MTAHTNERCKNCKLAVKNLLERAFGEVTPSYYIKAGTRPEDYRDVSCYEIRVRIHSALQDHRGYHNLVRTANLPRSDFYLPALRCLVEFDESQHFTIPRKIALEQYPHELTVGYSRLHWISLCNATRAVDNDKNTPFRDEQRAWYDTLRDFLPLTIGMEPTVRLYSKAMRWCQLNAEEESAIAMFKESIGNAAV